MTFSKIISAEYVPARGLPRPSTTAQRDGLRYERKVAAILHKQGFEIQHNPWFRYIRITESSPAYCCPDILVFQNSPKGIVIIEIKLSATPMALEKLKFLYCPVVETALGIPVKPLVVTKSLARWNGTGEMGFDKFPLLNPGLIETINSPLPVYLWPGFGPIT